MTNITIKTKAEKSAEYKADQPAAAKRNIAETRAAYIAEGWVLDISASDATLSRNFDTRDEAVDVAASFAKARKISVSSLTTRSGNESSDTRVNTHTGRTYGETVCVATVRSSSNLRTTKTTGDVNETAIKRIRSTIADIAKRGEHITIVTDTPVDEFYATYVN